MTSCDDPGFCAASSAMPAGDSLVFVYGTLRNTQPRAHVLEASDSARLIGPATTIDEFYMYGYKGGGFPYLLLQSIGGSGVPTKVKGEVWQVGPDIVKDLDMIEGHPSHYTRIIVPVKLDASEGGRTMDAYIYIMKQPHVIESMKGAYPRSFAEIPGGCWVDWVEKEMPEVWRTRGTR